MTLLSMVQSAATAATSWWEHDLDPNLFVIPFPQIGPLQNGIPIRFYSLAYLLGLAFAWWFMRRLSRQRRIALDEVGVADLIIPYALLGVMIGGRLGYVLFYDVDAATGRYAWLDSPLKILQIWEGGMASHGGLLGVLVAMWLFARRRHVPLLHLLDLCALTVPVGLFLGRVANFINGELWGRATTVSWAVLFPKATPAAPEFIASHPDLAALFQRGLVPRHPSQLYEALGEGLIVFAVLFAIHKKALPRAGLISGLFLLLYGVGRIVCEQFREPDSHIGYQWLGLTRGQILTGGLLVAGVALLLVARRRPPQEFTPPPPPPPPAADGSAAAR